MPERNDWYYWTKNKYVHFIRFRDREDQVATASIKPLSDDECREAWVAYGCHQWKVAGPCWSTYQRTGIVRTFDEAVKIVNEQVMAIVVEEFAPEPVHPLG